MAADYFLEIKEIEGESKDDKYKGQIELLSASMGVTNRGSFGAGGGGGSSKSDFQDVSITKMTDKASPKLMAACATGEHISKAVLHFRKAGKDQQEYLTITLSNVFVSSYQAGGHGDIPSESISLNFSKIEYQYKEQKADGTMSGPVIKQYDLSANKGK